ncbi:unnamed protein product [Lymnaea stagnalis]|uniref:Calponin-homology (CH) domain-containing protein n=1 Tax=Lymnaea stagnalis TaxID=6523 RepID=A0AAV2HWG7_LYMST
MSRSEEQWIAIQQKTFVNWANEQLSIGNKSVESLVEDLCDGVRLVALVEALQFKKIGKVYAKPNSRIQMLHNVSLALNAISEDNVKLVNIGTDDIVGGNLKLILGLIWHLIIRYQISSNKTKAPPKKLMLSWFQNALPALTITNFTSNWRDGIALHALLEYLKPGLSPKWAELSSKDSVQNCRNAMQLAKDHLNVPRVISPEDFASSDLDELSAMTYLSYFIRKNSPGYYNTLNWVCKQLKTTNISNLSTDWNDGYFLCGLVHSMGGEVPDWPNINRNDHLANCQLGIDCAKKLGVEPLLSASELTDPHVDHLSVMAYISKFQKITPRKDKSEKVELECHLHEVIVGHQASFIIKPADVDVDESKVKVWVSGPTDSPTCKVSWSNKVATCTFQPNERGLHKIYAQYDGVDIRACPITFSTQHDLTKVRVAGQPNPCLVGKPYKIQVFCPSELHDSIEIRLTSPNGELTSLNKESTPEGLESSFRPSAVGKWSFQTMVGNQEANVTSMSAFDPMKAWLTGPEHGIVGEEVSFNVNIRDCGSTDLETEVEFSGGRKMDDVRLSGGTAEIRQIVFKPKSSGIYRVKAFLRGETVNGSPKTVDVVDPGQIVVSGEGLSRGLKGSEAHFVVNKQGLAGDITAVIEASGQNVPVAKELRGINEYEFRYVPLAVGSYKIDITWDGKPVAGSPYTASITDKSRVILLDNVNALKDDSDHIVLSYDKEMDFHLDVSRAGPGKLTAEVLGPDGKLPVDVTQSSDKVKVSFKAKHEGDHYIHLYWSDVPLDFSPLLAYCPGPPQPEDASKVSILGKGAESARATVPAFFVIDGRKAGPGTPKVRLQGVQSDLPVEIKPLNYDRYKCSYLSNVPGESYEQITLPFLFFFLSFFLFLHKRLEKKNGRGGGIFYRKNFQFVSLPWYSMALSVLNKCTSVAGEVTAECHSFRHTALCDIKENSDGLYTLRICPTEPEKHVLQIRYDGVQVPGSPFIIRIGEPPDPTKVKVFGPGVENGLIDTFESRFLVDTHGAGAGQLAVKIRGPRGGFRVEMKRESKNERMINCRFVP